MVNVIFAALCSALTYVIRQRARTNEWSSRSGSAGQKKLWMRIMLEDIDALEEMFSEEVEDEVRGRLVEEVHDSIALSVRIQ